MPLTRMLPISIKTHREWTNPAGYRELAVWSNARLLEILVRRFTSTLIPPSTSNLLTHNYALKPAPNRTLNPTREYRLKAQLDDCARSTVANIEEGFKRPSTKEYLDFLGFSQGSLEEVKGDVNRSLHNNLIKSIPGSSLEKLGIDLKKWNDWCKDERNEVRLLEFRLRVIKGDIKGSYGQNNYYPTSSSTLTSPYVPLSALNPNALSYEIFMELINKTDYLMRSLVTSLQKSGTANENLKKDPGLWDFQKENDWLKKEMESKGFHQLENGQWVGGDDGDKKAKGN